MAQTYPAFTAYLSSGQVPGAFRDSEAEELLNQSVAAAELPVICASSRHGSIGAELRSIAGEIGLAHLAFLCGDPWNAPQHRSAYLLRGNELRQVEGDITRLLDVVARSARDGVGWLGSRPGEIVEALAASGVAPEPNFHGDELSPVEFFSYLKTLREYCIHAIDRGGALIHVQWGDS